MEAIQESTFEAFTALDGKVAEQEERLNSSIKDTGQKFETIHEVIAANKNQINILNATVRDAYGLGTNITRFVTESELLEAQLRSVNTSVQLQGASIEKLRVDTSRNISEVRERTQDSLDVIKNEVYNNTNELNDTRTSLSRRIDEVASELDTKTALLSQHNASINSVTGISVVAFLLSIIIIIVGVAAFIYLILRIKRNIQVQTVRENEQ